MILGIVRGFYEWLDPFRVALFSRSIPFNLRWRLLLLQPLTLITYTLTHVPYFFSRSYETKYLPLESEKFSRALIFLPPTNKSSTEPRPLHINVHAGAFIGGRSEPHAHFYERLAKETGAVVIAISHRFAPQHVFPSAIDDVDNAIKYIQLHALQLWNANPELTTVSGFSAGGNLILAATQQPNCHAPSPFAFRASVTFYASIDLRISPDQKPKSGGIPKKDPAEVLIPLFDSYPAKARLTNMENPRLNPIVADRKTLPEKMMMVVPGTDILVVEQLAFAKRVNAEDEGDMGEGRVEVVFKEKLFHGFGEGK